MISSHTIPPYAFKRFAKIEHAEQKDKIREEITDQMQEFLKNGGKIEAVGTTPPMAKPRSVRQVSDDAIKALQKYIDGIPSIKIVYCAKAVKHSIFIDGVYIESHDSGHKANQIAKRIYESKLMGKK